MTSLTVLAAGSVKRAFVPMLAAFSQQTGIATVADFAPAGLLRERIENGEPCALFASANKEHSQALYAGGLACALHLFARNTLMLTVRHCQLTAQRDWLSLLTDSRLRLATSTPGCDPGGDYSWQLFERIEKDYPGQGQALMQRALPLVGGRHSLALPAGEIAASWLIRQRLADIFVGYAHYATLLAGQADLRLVTIPPPWNVCCDYQLAQLSNTPAASQLCRFILSQGQSFLRAAGFLPPAC